MPSCLRTVREKVVFETVVRESIPAERTVSTEQKTKYSLKKDKDIGDFNKNGL